MILVFNKDVNSWNASLRNGSTVASRRLINHLTLGKLKSGGPSIDWQMNN